MSHLIEEYAKSLGVKANNYPVIFEHPWPIPFDKYILISANGEVPSKTYKHFAIALDMLVPILNKHGIHIIQIGSSKDPKFENVSLRLVDISARQLAYIVSHSMLYIGSDSVWSHYANLKNIPIVTLHGNAFAGISNGYWNDNQINLEAKWEHSPCFAAVDPHSSINKIKPEEICKASFKLLGIPHQNKLKTIHIGKIYGEALVEIVPDFSPNIEINHNYTYFLRCDFTDNMFLDQWCNHLPRLSIFVRMGTDLNIIKKYKNKLNSILFEVKDSKQKTKEFVIELKKLCGNVVLLAKNQDLAILRNQWFDYKVLPKAPTEVTDIGFKANCCIASSKIVIDKNGAYSSLFHRKAGNKEINKLLPVVQNQEFFEEIEHFAVFEREN